MVYKVMPNFKIENSLNINGWIAGVDEAGRGPWAGPVVAGAVCFPDLKIADELAPLINDSKKLTPKKREKVFDLLQTCGAYIGVGQAGVEEIDSLNILQATFLAMHRAVSQIHEKHPLAFTLIDGNRLPKSGWPWPAKAVIDGDALSLSIAAGSIIAKVTRDRIMCCLAEEFPMYGWEKNAGYGAPAHIAGLQQYGITPHHRKSYAPIAKIIQSAKGL